MTEDRKIFTNEQMCTRGDDKNGVKSRDSWLWIDDFNENFDMETDNRCNYRTLVTSFFFLNSIKSLLVSH